MNKRKHFIVIVSPDGESVTIDIALSEEEYELVNRISTLFSATADITEPILVVSKPIPAEESLEDGVVEEE
jgi:hypothetical protein